MQHTVDAAPLGCHRLTCRLDLLGDGDVELEHVDPVAQLASGPFGQAQRPPGTGEHDLGALLACNPGDAERQRSIGQDTGDDDLLTLEQTHVGNVAAR